MSIPKRGKIFLALEEGEYSNTKKGEIVQGGENAKNHKRENAHEGEYAKFLKGKVIRRENMPNFIKG